MNRRTLNGPRTRTAPLAPLRRGYYSDSSEESDDDESSEEDFDDDLPQEVPTRLCHAFSRQRTVFTMRINRENPERSREEREALIEGLCIDFERNAQSPKQETKSASFFASSQWTTCLDHKEMVELEANMLCFSQFVEEANRILLRKTVAGVKSSLRLLLGVCADANTSSVSAQESLTVPADECQQNDCAPKGPVTITRLIPECNLSTQVEVTPARLSGEVSETGLGQLNLSPSQKEGDPLPHASVVAPTSFARPRIKTCEARFIDADPKGSVFSAGFDQQFHKSSGLMVPSQQFVENSGPGGLPGSINSDHSRSCHLGVTPMKEFPEEGNSSPLVLPEVKGACGCKLFISTEKVEFDEEPIGPFGSLPPGGGSERPVGILPPVPIQPDPG